MVKKKTPENQLKFIAVIVASIAICIVGLSYLTHSMKKEGAILTYQQCIEIKDSKILEIYPSICITKDGKRFVNPADQYQCGKIGWSTAPQRCY